MDFNVHARTRSYGYSNLKDPANKFDFDEFKRLAKEDGIENIHVSSEFFMKYKDMKIKDLMIPQKKIYLIRKVKRKKTRNQKL